MKTTTVLGIAAVAGVAWWWFRRRKTTAPKTSAPDTVVSSTPPPLFPIPTETADRSTWRWSTFDELAALEKKWS